MYYIWQGEFGNEIMWGYPEVCWAARRAEAAGERLRVLTRNPGAQDLYADLAHVEAAVLDPGMALTEAQAAFAGRNRGYYCRGPGGKNTPRSARFRPLRLDIDWPRRRERWAVVHARNMQNNKKNRNWKRRLDPAVAYLRELGYRVICIGAAGQSLHLEGTDNRIGADLSAVIELLKSSAFLLGPAGGPHLLAAWCGTPVFSWNCKDKRLFPGFEGNPFGVAHFHPWSMEPTAENMTKYHTMNYRLSLAELRRGVAWMLESL